MIQKLDKRALALRIFGRDSDPDEEKRLESQDTVEHINATDSASFEKS
jgi:hypothetical protein